MGGRLRRNGHGSGNGSERAGIQGSDAVCQVHEPTRTHDLIPFFCGCADERYGEIGRARSGAHDDYARTERTDCADRGGDRKARGKDLRRERRSAHRQYAKSYVGRKKTCAGHTLFRLLFEGRALRKAGYVRGQCGKGLCRNDRIPRHAAHFLRSVHAEKAV